MENRKLNILFISSWYPNKLAPLNGIFVKRHAAALAEMCNMSAIFIRSGESFSIEETVEDGIYTLRGYYKNPAGKIPVIYPLLKLARYISIWQKVLSVYINKKGKPDLIHANIIYPIGMVAMRLKRRWRVPYIISEHWTGYMPEDGRYKGFLKKRISARAVARASAITTPSQLLSRTMQSLGLKNNYTTISNVVDTELFNISHSFIKPAGSIRFIHISSLDDAQKNASGMIRAFKQFRATHPNSTLTIVCNEEVKENLEQVRKKEPFSEEAGVYVTGRKTGAGLISFLQQADVFILFSNFETQSVVLLEAMCCGIPVIASRCGGPEEFITPVNGLLVDKGNEAQLVAAMEFMLTNRNTFKAEDIRKSVVDMVSKQAVARKFMELYNKVLEL